MENKLIRILLVESNRRDVRLLRELLSDMDTDNPLVPVFEIEWAERLSTALKSVSAIDIDVVLCSMMLTGDWGLNTFLNIRARAPHLPIVILSDLANENIAIQAVQQGAQDYLIKERLNGELLIRSLRYAIERKRVQNERQHHARELMLFNSFVENLTTKLKWNQVLQLTVETAPLLFPKASGVTIQLLEEETENLVTQADSYGIATDRLRRLIFAPGEGIAGLAVKERRVINVADVLSDSRFVAGPVNPPYRALMAAPFTFEGKVQGTLSLESTIPHAFSKEDELLVQLFARHAAIALSAAAGDD